MAFTGAAAEAKSRGHYTSGQAAGFAPLAGSMILIVAIAPHQRQHGCEQFPADIQETEYCDKENANNQRQPN